MIFERRGPISSNAINSSANHVQMASIITCNMPGSMVPIVASAVCKCAMSSQTKKAAIKPAKAGKGMVAVYFFKFMVFMMSFLRGL